VALSDLGDMDFAEGLMGVSLEAGVIGVPPRGLKSGSECSSVGTPCMSVFTATRENRDCPFFGAGQVLMRRSRFAAS
jgi:hypothetical protein